ncbi:hypothetical protein [Curvivirga aplysinae]|uniref:hypothetical protein n=1 Tax=Curvivirga aplysinae TaxID=2529852 RepID=UPI0012BB6C2B|nr:hypothetical protein [Curvivirga aplysinae]MTI08932.1 hypothetical protein [Curvivirga aplysinae]
MTHKLKRLFVFMIGGIFFAFLNFSSHAEGFLSALPEVPLHEKISEIAGSEVSFDAPTGRIIQIAASGVESKKNILNFYKATMPQLGWTVRSSTEFTREKEKLSLSLSTENGETLVQFELSPINADHN